MKSKYNYYEYRLATKRDELTLTPIFIGTEDKRLKYHFYFRVTFKGNCKVGQYVPMRAFSSEVLSCTGYYKKKWSLNYVPFILRKGIEYD